MKLRQRMLLKKWLKNNLNTSCHLIISIKSCFISWITWFLETQARD